MNCLPGRLVFLSSPAAKARLEPSLMAGNVANVRDAPVTVIVAHDARFYEHLPHEIDRALANRVFKLHQTTI